MDHRVFYKTQEIFNHLDDDISKALFDTRTMYSIDRLSRNQVIERNGELFDDWIIPELDNAFDSLDSDSICIFGAGNCGYLSCYALEHSNYKDRDIIFTDNNPNLWGTEFVGKRIVKPDDLKRNHFKGIVVIANVLAFSEIYHQLLFLVDRNQIFAPANQTLLPVRGKQYFDVLSSGEKEIFVDCRCYDGNDSIEFTKWCDYDYQYIYGFEPNRFDYEITCKTFESKGIKNFRVFNKAVSDYCGEIAFEGDAYTMGHINAASKSRIPCDTIDNLCEGRITFIKMDIEGGELNAIAGAERTIKAFRPKMAICIYHKLEDIWTIPMRILELNESYKFSIRQYWMWPEECVLYAF